MATTQQQLGATPPAEHLTAERPFPQGSNEPLNKRSEWYCSECYARISVSPSSEREYGHQRDCEHCIWEGEY